MTEIMNISSLPGGSERFIKRKDVNKRLSYIAGAPTGLSNDLADASEDYDSSVVFAYPPKSATATALATLEAPEAAWYRHRFRRETIDDSELVVAGTALGKALRSKNDVGYANSAINTESTQMVYTEQLIHDDQLVGAIQHSFSPLRDNGHFDNLIGDDAMEALAKGRRADLTELAANVALLLAMSKELGSLGLLLERKKAAAPDAFFARIDTKGSTLLALGAQQEIYEAYQNQCQVFMRSVLDAYEKRYLTDHYGVEAGYSDQGDGAYLVFPLPQKYNPYNQRALDHYHQYTLAPLLGEIEAGLTAIGRQYTGDLIPHPEAKVHGDFGNAQINGLGRYVSPTMTALAKHKEK